MAEHAAQGGLSKMFNMHNFHYLMLAGMAVAASVAATVSTGLPITIPNVISATVESAWHMVSGLGQIPEFVSNFTATNWDLTYQWGAAASAHGAHAGGAGAMASMAGMDHSAHMIDSSGMSGADQSLLASDEKALGLN